jgi:hypothetical protein
VGNWDPELGGRRLESQVQGGEKIAEPHLRAWRIAREEVLSNVTRWIRLVIANFYAYTGKVIHEDRQLHSRLPDELWDRLQNFIESLSRLPCWVDRNLSSTVFGPKQNSEYWEKVFQTGKAPSGIQILAAPLDLNEMIRSRTPVAGKKS